MSEQNSSTGSDLKIIIEALLLAAGGPLSLAQLTSLLESDEGYGVEEIGKALEALRADLDGRGIELVEVSSGFRLQTRESLLPWVSRLWEERPQRYSRALLETLALIAYRQPITRGEIEEVRGVSVRSNIIRTLQEREWIRVVGHRDVPGKPALFGTTRMFLDYFNLTSLDDLPSLAEIRDMESLEPELDFEAANEAQADADTGTDSQETSEAESDAEADEPNGESESDSADSADEEEPAEQSQEAR